MKILLDFRMKPIFLHYFQSIGMQVIKIIGTYGMYDEILGHPDIYCTNINGKVILASNIHTDKKLSSVELYGENVESSYPKDVKYNVCVTKKYAIGNFKYVAKEVKEEIMRQNLEIISVNQGYTKCSLIALNDQSYITSDIGIKDVLEKRGLSVMYVDSSSIKLLDKNGNYSKMHGFIGGATFLFDNKFILFGDIDKLNVDKEAFRNFIKLNGYEIIDFKGEDIIDYGGCIEI